MALFTKVDMLYPPVLVVFPNAGGSSDHSLLSIIILIPVKKTLRATTLTSSLLRNRIKASPVRADLLLPFQSYFSITHRSEFSFSVALTFSIFVL
ncbi:unnamed protein product [Bursaphelenchus xylophilus]|uniref:(pine wood nematode) hypothetical protein n=1 Tax=Bursaphelenchus xylophilus TaxID=6326 RepID=A0A7I8X5R0_BURXY|nr:unnamed protein product [Bursaphelenchus xylophilus]CAG9122914.1 unnamed protein product [Bursaphelenchus xylophilus]